MTATSTASRTCTTQRALDDARRVDRAIEAGADPGPLAGVPFAVKNLFDVAGSRTRAGSVIELDRPPATTDAAAVRRLRAAGAVVVAATNMDEYAHGFTTENGHARDDAATRRTRDASQAGLPAGRRLPWPRDWSRSPSARTPTARSACPPRCAGPSG
ncbi:MAG: amidase family protein [Nocardioidaceae bacterium]